MTNEDNSPDNILIIVVTPTTTRSSSQEYNANNYFSTLFEHRPLC